MQEVQTLRRRGVRPSRAPEARRLAAVLEQAFGYQTERDLLEHYPRRYLTRGELTDLAHAKKGAVVTLTGTVKHLVKKQPRRNLRILEIRVADEAGSGVWSCTWFNQPWHASRLPVGTLAVFSGRLRRVIAALLDRHGRLPDFLPEHLRRAHGLIARGEAMQTIHRPEDLAAVERARRRLVYDELFVLQVGLALRRRALAEGERGHALRPDGPLTEQLLASLPFTPTKAQSRAMAEIGEDLARPRPMHRLLQGEVGSGKTLVSLHMLLAAVQSGFQGAIMAPTGAARERVRAAVAAGEVDILVGTHALLSEGVDFKRLGAVVVDEQHRFGVHQRVRLREKGDSPHVLIMTATPIPRTLALTLYGDLDVSTLDELPPGRHPIATHLVADLRLRDRAYQRVREEVAAGHQAYVVCALKDESDKIEIRSAKAEAERLRAEVFPDLRVGLVYGDMAAREKEATMDRFRAGEVDVLVSTTVIEVGVDVANATVMLIEDADRFGLSQLHQLRGRVGRGTAPGLCILFADPQTDEGRARMEAITRTTDDFDWVRRARADAFALVEADPELAGPAHRRLRQEVLVRLGDGRAEWLARG